MTGTKSLIRTIPYGAIWTHFNVPISSDGSVQNMLLSFPDDELFATHEHPYFGNTIGRVANRIADGVISNLDGKDHHVTINEGTEGNGNCLHGGAQGWGAKTWSGPENITEGSWDAGIKNLTSSTEKTGTRYTLISPDGDEGFPGEIHATTTYFEGRGPNGEVVLDIEYEARLADTSETSSTVISMTNHAYFNLNGAVRGATNRDQQWTLDAHTATLTTSAYLALRTDKQGIPNGKISNHPLVPSTPNTPFSLTGPDGNTLFIDDCFVAPGYTGSSSLPIAIDSRAAQLQTLGTFKGETSGIVMRMQSTEPAFQLYTGKFIDVGAYGAAGGDGEGEGGLGYGPFSGFCVEPSRFVDAAGRQRDEMWRDQVLLRKGEVYGARNRYWAWKEE